jgi:hypothetical protein
VLGAGEGEGGEEQQAKPRVARGSWAGVLGVLFARASKGSEHLIPENQEGCHRAIALKQQAWAARPAAVMGAGLAAHAARGGVSA